MKKVLSLLSPRWPKSLGFVSSALWWEPAQQA
jgi:hypothetical protein